MSVTPGAVIGPDDQKSRILALGSGVGLQGNGMEACDLREPLLKLAEQEGVPRCLGRWDKGMKRGDPIPSQGKHLGSRVELHRA